MRRAVRRLASAFLAVLTCGTLAASSARAQIAWAPCGESNDYACGHLTVPIDPSGVTPGVITLAIRRHRAPVGEDKDAVIALAGGPGQPALPLAEQFTKLLGPIISTRDLIVFDQRGVGLSHPLSCHRFEQPLGNGPLGPAIAQCADQLGPTRTFYTTAQSVADIEAIRQAGGYQKLVLYGTSYGTKVAERYAQAYPSHVEALVLDSVVPPNGPDPLNRATFAAVPRILHQLCARRACAKITHSPVGDLAKVVARANRKALRGRWIDGHGHAHRVAISSDELFEVLLAGDLEPTLRAEFPAAIRSAANGDTAPLARLLERAQSDEEAEAEAESSGEHFDTPLYYTTSCEEELFPWNRAATPATRLAEARAQINALPASTIAPFAANDVLEISDMPACAFWPYTTPAPTPVQAPFPAVPTLVLSGADDLRTPTANAREVAAELPGSHLLVVPNVGHSVLGSDPSGCASKALQALFAPAPIKACAADAVQSSLLALTPLAPARLSDVAPAKGYSGRAGRTLNAVMLTLADFLRQAALQALGGLATGNLTLLTEVRVGGLRAGWAGLLNGDIVLDGYSYVPGVSVSGRITASETVLRVGGGAAARGTLRVGQHGRLNGELGGVPVRNASAGTTTGAITEAITARSAQLAASPGEHPAVLGELDVALIRLTTMLQRRATIRADSAPTSTEAERLAALLGS
jgi:pimeloyl-ACP methyl ester carboxylesterase